MIKYRSPNLYKQARVGPTHRASPRIVHARNSTMLGRVLSVGWIGLVLHFSGEIRTRSENS